MSNDLISRNALINALFVHNGKMWPNTDIDNFPTTINVKDVKKAIRNASTAYDVDKVVERLDMERNRMYREDGSLMVARTNISIDKAIEIVKSGGTE